jgi:hypothetical protein
LKTGPKWEDFMDIRINAVPALVAFNCKDKLATIRLRGRERDMPGSLWKREWCNEIRVEVSGFAAMFATGSKVWGATAIFEGKGEGFGYVDVRVAGFKPPGSGFPPRIVGFIDQFDRGRLGTWQGCGRH